MRAILIDAKNQTIKEVETKGDLQDMYKLIDCRLVDTVYGLDDHVIFVDDEGLYNSDNEGRLQGFTLNGGFIAGNGLLFATDIEKGDKKGATISIQEVMNAIDFYSVFADL